MPELRQDSLARLLSSAGCFLMLSVDAGAAYAGWFTRMPPPPPIVAITGAHGWVGRCLARAFQKSGWRVRALVRKPSVSGLETDDEAKFTLGEAVDPTTLEGVQALVHCAYDFAPTGWAEIERVNVRGTEQLFQAAAAAGVQRTVLISTMSAFAGCKSLYGKAKLEMEHLAAARGAFVVRPGLVYGEKAGGMYGSLSAQVEKGRLIPLIGAGTQRLNLVHEEDLAHPIVRFCTGAFPAPARPLTTAHPQGWTLREILAELARRAHRRVHFLPIPWQPVWWLLRAMEACGLRPPFRSDSLLSLMHQDPAPDFSGAADVDFHPRPYSTASLLLADP